VALSRAEASIALQDVALAQERSATLRGYQSASPHLIIWGFAWAAGYTVTDLAPHWANPAWLAVTAVASAGDILAARADGRRSGGRGLLIPGLCAIFAVFVVSTLVVMQPQGPRQVGAFIPLVVAAAYAVLGLMNAPRLLVLGAGLAILTLVGFYTLPAHFLLWMAGVGGGGLILGGLWLRQA
jgi:hypothetical protein